MMFRSPYFKRYCKECGNITHIRKDSRQFDYYASAITVLTAAVVFLTLELLRK